MKLRMFCVVAIAAAAAGYAWQEPPGSARGVPVHAPAALAQAESTPPEQEPTGPGQTEPVRSSRDAAAGAATSAGTGASGLPQRAPEPRTMQDQWPVFALLAASWVGIVGYLLVIGRQSRRVADLVDRADRAGRSA